MSDKPGNPPTPADFFNWLNQMMSPLANATATMNPNPAATADPMAFWKSLMDKNQETYAKFMQQMVGTPEFAKTLGQSANATATYRNMVRQAAKSYLEAANMPSRDDLSQLSEQIVSLDGRLDALNDTVSEDIVNLFESMAQTLENLTARVASIETQLQSVETVASRLEKLETQLNQLDAKLSNKPIESRRNSRKNSPIETEMGE